MLKQMECPVWENASAMILVLTALQSEANASDVSARGGKAVLGMHCVFFHILSSWSPVMETQFLQCTPA